ncbi:PREDICTED: uncharacterized protein LOC108562800 [Nicrophorus vespilloides]|uniref:Uncharacterized protein LOC108562800 n=1 Tax=Nicrophorus vespilloides TaxID=110193 RepID=A0ABM1MQ74_NICVS|nr:PREDICTED: uncharacterized protein LOC108562800 [Nicrophorus vespilloides]
MIITIEVPKELRQIVPVMCGAGIAVSFGMMLGWASVAYPTLLQEATSPIPLNIEITPLIAGFLWEGNTLGCLFSTSKYLPSKLAVCLCFCLQIVGWILMYFSQNIFWFLASRASVGFAHGYGMGQLKRYIKETCDPSVAAGINNYMPTGMALGVLMMFTLGANVDFRSMAIYSTIIPILGLITFGAIPKAVKEEESGGSGGDGNRINNVMSVQDKNDLTKNMTPVATHVKPLGVFDVIKDPESRHCLLIMFLLVFLQQYGGGAANIVYSQIILVSTHNPNPKVGSIVYAFCFLVSMTLSLKFAKKFSRKFNLVTTLGCCIFILSLIALYFFLRHDLEELNPIFRWAPLFLLVLYNFFHTFGLATVPLLMLSEMMPKYSVNIGSKFWTIHFSMSAVISTKIFQIIYTAYGMSMAYIFFVLVLIVGFLIMLVVKDFTPDENSKPSTIPPRLETVESAPPQPQLQQLQQQQTPVAIVSQGQVNQAFEISENTRF